MYVTGMQYTHKTLFFKCRKSQKSAKDPVFEKAAEYSN